MRTGGTGGAAGWVRIAAAVVALVMILLLYQLRVCISARSPGRLPHASCPKATPCPRLTSIELPPSRRRASHAPTVPPPPSPVITATDSRERRRDVYRVAIKVFTYKRVDGLRRLLSSLTNADYMGRADVDLTLFLDFPKKPPATAGADLADDGTRSFVDGFDWPHGSLTVHRRLTNNGLKRTIMEAWYPTRDDEVAVFFEDDIEVAPDWYRWTIAALRQYAVAPSRRPVPGDRSALVPTDKTLFQDRLLGISLFRPVHDELSGKGCSVNNGFAPFALQQPCSWGAAFLPRPWRAFRKWYDAVGNAPGAPDPQVVTLDGDEPTSNSWDSKSSWKKYLIKLMTERGWFMVYPNLPQRYVFSTNHLMKGEHPTPPKALFELPLLPSSATAISAVAEGVGDARQVLEASLKSHFMDLPDAESLWVFDVLFRRVEKGVLHLPRAN